MVTFVFSNPRHHLDMMVPVARILGARGVPYRFVSLAELRGFPTPSLAERLPGADVRRAIPRNVRRDPSVGAGLGTSGGAGAGRAARALALLRRAARAAVWRAALGPRMRRLLGGTSVAVVPNDAAYPYAELAAELGAQRVPFALLQEGIRFPLPAEDAAGLAYGKGGAAAVCAWGEASAEHFRAIGVPAAAIHVTGSPRFDGVSPEAWQERGRALAGALGLSREPLLYLSNTIDDQGFCTTAAKLALFTSFAREAAPVLAREGRALVVKLHPREDTAAFRRAAAALPDAPIHVLPLEAPLYAVLAMGRAAVVLASTVGLEAIAFGLPLGVLAIPGHGHVFEYVARGAAIGLAPGGIGAGVARLLEAAPPPAAAPFLERHLAHRGQAAARIADQLAALTTAPTAQTARTPSP
ncbi:MAG TPA: hypothetical protein VNO30_22700 [Kofleriaceae bacterium]|nr:hypothetical protein [Kofleriaceae bacterium]